MSMTTAGDWCARKMWAIGSSLTVLIKTTEGNLSAINNDRHEIRFTYGVDDNGINGRLLKIQRTIDGAGTTEEKQAYDAYGRLARSEITANQSPVLSRAYRYLPRGEIIQHTKKTYRDQQPITATTTYHYDALKRLTKETQQQVSAAGAHTRRFATNTMATTT